MTADGKIIIYTSITGGYDTLEQPFNPPSDFEFICFVDGASHPDRIGVWKIETIPFACADMIRLARYPKLNPHKVLPPSSSFSLWIDANIVISDSSIYELCRSARDRGVRYAGVPHPFNDCPYREACKCLSDRRETLPRLLGLVRLLRSEGVPEHSGMMESGVIFRTHNDPDVVAFDEMWWEYLMVYSRRDQLSHTLCLLKNPSVKPEWLLGEGYNIRNFPGFDYVRHPAKKLSWLGRKLKYGPNRLELPILEAYIKFTRH